MSPITVLVLLYVAATINLLTTHRRIAFSLVFGAAAIGLIFIGWLLLGSLA